MSFQKTAVFAAVAVVGSALAASSETPPRPGAAGERSPYAGHEARAIKALSEEQVQAYREGHGLGMALAAELNHHPGPRHVLELARELHLTSEQMGRTKAIHQRMSEEARRLGRALIDEEARLEALFAGGGVEERPLAEATAAIARIQGELRFAHLRAHVETRAVLSDEQVAAYDRLRGYAGDVAPHRQRH